MYMYIYVYKVGYSHTVDWWSLGVTMFKLLTGMYVYICEIVFVCMYMCLFVRVCICLYVYVYKVGYSHTVDWWSLGVTMFKLLTGMCLFISFCTCMYIYV
jgi:serine/threonine protein kinase